ncbi:MAG: tRNA pseudouridine(38-40) synthase TruA [Eubacteriaceae bacterium]|nr:tRNA pseudouridine(38-40) synthase TruA [Eubacteriaceae bacterium]
MKRNIRMTIAYDGGRYNGWQRLSTTDNTIQGKLENVVSKMTSEAVEIIGSGRTDAGVHARGQVANFWTETKIPLHEMQTLINHYLPNDIAVTEISQASDRFHSRYNACSKKYSYYLWNDPVHSVFQRKYSFHIPEKFDLEKIRKAAEIFQGTHDFIGFSSVKKTSKSTVRTINSIQIIEDEKMLRFIFSGDGFLYNMIRIIMGTLVEIGSGKKEISSINEILQTGKRSEAGYTLPPHGLFLDKVYY